MKVLVVGHPEAVLGFSLAGVDGRAVQNAEQANHALDEALAAKDVGIVLVTKDVARMMQPRMDDLKLHSTVPLIVEIPGPEGVSPDEPALERDRVARDRDQTLRNLRTVQRLEVGPFAGEGIGSMPSVDENIQGLSRAILDEARGETEHVKSDAQAKADEIRKRAQEQADAERKAILEQASQEAGRLRSQALATAQLKARSSELAHREKLLERVFKAVRQQLGDVQKRQDYEQVVAALIREGLEQLNSDKVEIRADKTTQKVLTTKLLDQLSKECHAELSLGETLDQGTGVVLDAAGGHLTFDNTFETRLSRLQSSLRPATFQILMGESS